MRLTDKELDDELKSAKISRDQYVKRNCPEQVIARAQIYVGILEELLLWRENGRKWLNHLNSKSGSLSDTAFAGKENDGQMVKSQK